MEANLDEVGDDSGMDPQVVDGEVSEDKEEGIELSDGEVEKAEKARFRSWANRIRHRAKELVTDLEHGYMELAEILYRVYDTPKGNQKHGPPLFVGWGYKTFEDYVNQELGFAVRKAQRLRLIWHRLEVELSALDSEVRQRIVKLGWTKVREIVNVLTIENALEWVEKAERMSSRDLEEEVRKFRDQVDQDRLQAISEGRDPTSVATGVPMKAEKVWKTFPFDSKDDRDLVLQALERASQLSGTDMDTPNLVQICTDFLATNDFLTATGETKLRYIAKIEKLLGLKLIVANADCTELMYGMETLAKLEAAYKASQ